MLHPLKILRTKIRHYNIGAFDIETYGRKNLFLLGGCIGNNKKSVMPKCEFFIDKKQMMEKMKILFGNKDTLLYATNLMFDFNALYFGSKQYRNADVLLRGGDMIFAKHDNIKFVDTLNYAKFSVKNIGKMLGMPKLEHPSFLGKKYKNMAQLKKLKIYNSRDCKITKVFMEQFQDVINSLGGELKITIASTALNLYRRKYMPINIHHEKMEEFNDGKSVKEFIFDSYYGGRTEVFKRGASINMGRYYLYDFNSLYPSAMLNKYPLPESAWIVEDNKGNLGITLIEKFEGCADVMIECPYIYYPLLPYRMNGKLCFPYGKFRGTYTNIELREALKLGYKIIKCYKIIYYSKTFYPFKKWVNELYAIRIKYKNEGNNIYSTMIKLMLNSLYGKFATSHISEYHYVDFDSSLDELMDSDFDFDRGCGYKEIPKECDYNYILPILSSYTTAYARIKLYNKLVELKGIYCDTDSIITGKKLISSDKLGELKLERISDKLNIVKPKHYYFLDDINEKSYIKIKGVKLSNDRMKDFEKSITGKNIRQMKFLKLKEALRSGKLPNEKIIMFKKIKLTDNKREWIKPYNKNILEDSKPLKI